MAFNNIFKCLNFLEILSKSKPILLNDFITQVVNKVLNEVDHPLIEQVGRGEEGQESFLRLL